MIFKQNAPLFSTDIERKEGETILYINYFGAPFVPSLADSPEVMSRTLDALADNSNVSQVVFVQQRNYHYPFEQVSLLLEIGHLYNYLLKQERVLSPERLSLFGDVAKAHEYISYLTELLRQDPLGSYLEIKRLIRTMRTPGDSADKQPINFIRFLERVQGMLEKTKLISSVLDVIDMHAFGDRALYEKLFRPDVMPNFTFTRLIAQLPDNASLIDQYEIPADEETITVTILRRPNETGYL